MLAVHCGGHATRFTSFGCLPSLGTSRHRPSPALRFAPTYRNTARAPRICVCEAQNREVLVGDILNLTVFALYKQISALIFLPSFPGWLAPLHFNPDRFVEFTAFAATLVGTWVGAGLVVGGYRNDATADLNTALARTCRIWLASMPVCAAQLVLVTAVEGRALVGDEGFAAVLPLAASGPGEPFVTAAGVLGLMSCWRAFYTTYLDIWNLRSVVGTRLDRGRDLQHFLESLQSALLLCIACCIVLQFLGSFVGEEWLEEFFGGLPRSLGVLTLGRSL